MGSPVAQAGEGPSTVLMRQLVQLEMRGTKYQARQSRALLGLGLRKGDRVAILAYNCVEWMEIYAGTANAGLVMVPINFRLVGAEIQFIVENSAAQAVIVQDDLVENLDEVRPNLVISEDHYIHFGCAITPGGYRAYEDLIAAASSSEPAVDVAPGDIFAFMYTSGTTGRPKGAMRSHGGMALQNLALLTELELTRRDTGLLVMPIRQYFLWVGSILLVALFAADWLLPEPAAHPHSQIPPHERVNLQIRSNHKWPERVVLDTTGTVQVRARLAAREDAIFPSRLHKPPGKS